MPETNILRIGNPILRQKSDLVADITSNETRDIVQKMLSTMKAANGAGLAAPQIGILKRIIVFGLDANPRYPDAEAVPMTILINPQYKVVDEGEEAAWEGCLSIPGMRGKVYRPKEIAYTANTIDGEKIERTARGFHARVFLHEYDHLDGVLYLDRIKEPGDFGYIEELEQAGFIPKIAE